MFKLKEREKNIRSWVRVWQRQSRGRKITEKAQLYLLSFIVKTRTGDVNEQIARVNPKGYYPSMACRKLKFERFTLAGIPINFSFSRAV